ncbi:hypothetical protein K491DRAFT_678671 [Lophiostoma macrostomum CBS 122681]|uniref:Uncharacterized protein n=1 Tax=Lophiostoma macrostomum CBS 122681 TaxID=1314788 RepID=A0A6A6T934_9PLEO|nr:hypothetical protein K491DRAFT_678671 [Lophiostoma macrostomum CBS 122681]
MGWFSNANEPTTNTASYPTTTNPSSTFAGSGAEQDRYGARFDGLGAKAADKIKEATSDATRATKDATRDIKATAGAEQDRLESHFSLDLGSVKAVAQQIFGNGPSHPALGYDGQQRATRWALTKGTGSEQDRFGGHFGVDKSSIQNAAQSVTDRIKQAPK